MTPEKPEEPTTLTFKLWRDLGENVHPDDGTEIKAASLEAAAAEFANAADALDGENEFFAIAQDATGQCHSLRLKRSFVVEGSCLMEPAEAFGAEAQQANER